MTENVIETTKKKGPKPNPFVAYQKANEKAERARKAYEKVQQLAEAKEKAEAEEQAAYKALQEHFEAISAPSQQTEV